MSIVKSGTELMAIKDDKGKFKYIELFNQEIKNIINGNLEVLRNLRHNIVEYSFLEADVAKKVLHGLGYKPNGYLVIGRNVAMIVYDGGGPSTINYIPLKSDTIGTAKILFF